MAHKIREFGTDNNRSGDEEIPMRKSLARPSTDFVLRAQTFLLSLSLLRRTGGQSGAVAQHDPFGADLLNLTADKESNPGYFLCQRIAHLHLERFPLPVNAGKPARELHAALLMQLESLRQNLNQNPKKDMPGDVAKLLVQLNTSARSLLAALAAAPDTRLKANSDLR
jgi:hypothetical protein